MDARKRLTMLEQMLLQQPDDPFLIYGIALEHAGMGNHTEAEQWFSRLFSRFPGYMGGYYAYSSWLLSRGRTPEAIRCMEDGIALARKLKDQKTERELRSLLEEALEN